MINEYWLPWTISNSVILLVLLAAVKRPKLARLLFALMFGAASWVNYTMANSAPEDYLNYAAITPFELYRDFITGWFKEHITVFVTLISFGQGAIALGLILDRMWVRLASYGAMVFFIGITPFGIGSAFPFTLIALAALYFVLKKDDLNFLWKFKSNAH